MPDPEIQDVQTADPSPAADKDVTPSESSTGEGVTETSYRDVVAKALEPEESPDSDDDGEAPPEKAETKPEPKPEAGQAKKDDLSDDPTAEELKALPQKTRARMEKLLEQRFEMKSQVDELSPKAQQWDRIEQFREANGLTPQSVANAIQITALIENEPDKAFQMVEQIYRSLAERTGALLSPELREAVKNGEITAERARELSQAKAQSALTGEQKARQEARAKETEANRVFQARVETAGSAATEWDRQKLERDPDWTLKRTAVAKAIEKRFKADGIPETKEATLAVLEEEAKAVEELLGSFRPKKRTITPSPAGGSARGASKPAPKDHYDVVNQALG